MERFFGTSETAIRLLPVCFSILSIPLVYLVGKTVFNDKRVGLVAAVSMAFIPWYVIRARVIRPYTGFQFFYLLFVYFFYRGFEAANPLTWPAAPRLLQKTLQYCAAEKINLLYLGLAFVFLLIGKKLQDLAMHAGPTVFLYALLLLAVRWHAAGRIFKEVRFSKYAWVVYLGLVGIVTAPLLLQMISMRPITDLTGLDSNFWERLRTVPFWAFQRYITDAVIGLHPGVWICGVAGLGLAFYPFRQQAWYVAVFFLVPFLIQSFLFNNPNAVKAQYLFFVFPYFLVLAGFGVVRLAELAAEKLLPEKGGRLTFVWVCVGVILVVITIWQGGASYAFVQARKHGDLHDRSNELYANWRDASAYIQRYLQPDDVVLSSQPWSVFYYLHKADYEVRTGFNRYHYLLDDYQNYKNQLRNPNPPAWPLRDVLMGVPMLKDYNMFVWEVEQHPRGWILACHKFFSPAFVDKRIVDYVRKNMRAVYADRDKTVWVLHWDFSARPSLAPIMTANGPQQSMEFVLPDPSGIQGVVSLQLDVSGAGPEALAGIRLNGGGPLPFRFVPNELRQTVEAVLTPEGLRAGTNRLQLAALPGDSLQVFHVGLTVEQGPANYSFFSQP
jgi:hypothetical protein